MSYGCLLNVLTWFSKTTVMIMQQYLTVTKAVYLRSLRHMFPVTRLLPQKNLTGNDTTPLQCCLYCNSSNRNRNCFKKYSLTQRDSQRGVVFIFMSYLVMCALIDIRKSCQTSKAWIKCFFIFKKTVSVSGRGRNCEEYRWNRHNFKNHLLVQSWENVK